MKTTLLLAVLLILLVEAHPAKSDTTFVSGAIVSQNWNIGGSPYVVTGDILVAGLTIDPGVSVLFAGNFEFLVQGVIEAIGSEQSQIIFTVKSGATSWKGIRFQNSNPGSYMKWCIVEKANAGGVKIIESFPSFINCNIRNNSSLSPGGGMVISNTTPGVLVISKCNFEQNEVYVNTGSITVGGGGLYLSQGTVELRNCQFLLNKVTLNTSGTIDTYAAGGGISTFGNLSLKNCLISRNRVFSYNSGCCQTAYSRGCGLYSFGGITSIKNSIIAYDSATSESNQGGGIYTGGNSQTTIENSNIVHNQNHGIWRENPSTMRIVNSIIYFNNNNSTQMSGTSEVTFCDVQGGFTGTGNINFAPILDSTLKVLSGSLCINAGNDSVTYNDVCFPPSLGGPRNDMGAHGGPGACEWNDRTIKIRLTALMEGLYNPVTNLLSRSQVQRLFLRNTAPPYDLVDAAAGTIGTNGVSTDFIFNVAPSGTYYLATKNFNCIETWSKSGGEPLVRNNSVYNYDFTSSASRAYGNNLILKGSEYCIYSGDVDQGGSVDGTDLAQTDNDAITGASTYISSDVNGDYFVDGSDLVIVDNNSYNFIYVMRP